MANPWLGVLLSEYEQHMKSPEVGQLNALSELFAEAMRRCRPSSVAILGIAGGNGLEHIDTTITTRVVGLDINPQYIKAVSERYLHLPGLELCCVDLSRQQIESEPVQLVHAALIFEHAGDSLCLENALSLVNPGGNLSVVLQLPGEIGQVAIASHFSSIEHLKSCFSLISPTWLCESLAERKFQFRYQTTRTLPAGKGFWMGIFSAPKSHDLK